MMMNTQRMTKINIVNAAGILSHLYMLLIFPLHGVVLVLEYDIKNDYISNLLHLFKVLMAIHFHQWLLCTS